MAEPYRIGGVVDGLAKSVRTEADPKRRLELLLELVAKVALEIDHLHWKRESEMRDVEQLKIQLADANTEIRKLRGRVGGKSEQPEG